MKMETFVANSVGCLKELLELLNGNEEEEEEDEEEEEEEKESNDVGHLELWVNEEFDQATMGVLWQILEHPESKITFIDVMEQGMDELATTGLTKLIEKWCTQVPALGPRKLWFSLFSKQLRGRKRMFGDLQRALKFPNNQIVEFMIADAIADPIADDPEEGNRGQYTGSHLLGPVLQHPNNELQTLHLGEIQSASDIIAFSLAFPSPNCKLRDVEITLTKMTLTEAFCILASLQKIAGLEQLSLCDDNGWNERRHSILTWIDRWLTRPGSQLKSFKWHVPGFDQDDARMLANILMNEHCFLEELDCDTYYTKEDAALPLLLVLRRPTCRLKSLKGNFRGEATALALTECLKDAACKLTSLALGDHPGSVDIRVSISILKVLCTSSCTLRTLTLVVDTLDVFPTLIDSLLSTSNRIRELGLRKQKDVPVAILGQLHRAVRRSNVVLLSRKRYEHNSFAWAFNQPFLQVMYTLLSVKQVARLGQSSWLRLLPIPKIILKIAKTLDWPLAYLRT